MVMQVIILDSGPLGLVTNPRMSPQATACLRWVQMLLSTGRSVFVPEIADYEIRRELLRANKIAGLARLDLLILQLGYLPITTQSMRVAAQLWAETRQRENRPLTTVHWMVM